MTFGERVKQARLAKGLTQSQLAKCAGYAGATSIASLETQGRCNAAAGKIVNLCKALDTDPNTILGWNDENKTFKVKVRRTTHERFNHDQLRKRKTYREW